MKKYTQLSRRERQQLFHLLTMGRSIDKIASRLGRHRSTLYREIDRNGTRYGYFPIQAQEKYESRKKQERPCKLQSDLALYEYVIRKLKKGWSPEQISGRIRFKKKPFYACPESIYRYIYRENNKELYHYLPYKKPKRKRWFARKVRACRYGEIRLITHRPEVIDSRETFGHWEGDSIEFRGTKTKTIATVVERKSRVMALTKNEQIRSEIVMGNIKRIFLTVPKKARYTLTFDLGSEFADYRQIENNLDCRVYYCEVKSPWQKGTNENTNGRLRRYLPRDIDIASVTQDDLDRLARRLNRTPRKCLGFQTPREVFLQHCKKFDGLML
jgi:IS30 family transposase